jgi:hypothetical protein
MATNGADDIDQDADTVAAAWRLLEAGDTLCISQVESVGFRMLLRRAHDLVDLQSHERERALESIEDLAQLLALWKPGANGKEREEAYFDQRYAPARGRPIHTHRWPRCWIRRPVRSCTATSWLSW